MIKIVEYKLHGGKVPYFIEDGGYYPHDDGKLIGITFDSDYYHVPKTNKCGGDLTELSADDILSLSKRLTGGEEHGANWLRHKGFIV